MAQKGQPKYLERDGLRDSLVEVYIKNPTYLNTRIVKAILDGGGMEDFQTVEDSGSNSYFLQNEVFRVQVRTDYISFNNVKEYQRWPSYGGFIKNVMGRVLSLPDIEVGRQMIRYISMYPGVSIFDNLNGDKMHLNAFPQLDGTEIRFKMDIADEQGHLGIATIRITDNLPSNKPEVKVSVVDIQIDTTTDNEKQEETLEFLHTEERNLYFSLLSNSFIESLGAHYE